jgi:hypothetical protein
MPLTPGDPICHWMKSVVSERPDHRGLVGLFKLDLLPSGASRAAPSAADLPGANPAPRPIPPVHEGI